MPQRGALNSTDGLLAAPEAGKSSVKVPTDVFAGEATLPGFLGPLLFI